MISWIILAIYALASAYWLRIAWLLDLECRLSEKLLITGSPPKASEEEYLLPFAGSEVEALVRYEGSAMDTLLEHYAETLENRHASGQFIADLLLNLGLLGTIIGFILMYIINQILSKCWISNNTKKFHNELINKLVRQTARWATAASQDDNPVIEVLHANYAAGYLWALKDIATNKDIENATKIDMNKFQKNVVDIQDKANKKLVKLCPNFIKTDNIYLAKIGGEA